MEVRHHDHTLDETIEVRSSSSLISEFMIQKLRSRGGEGTVIGNKSISL